MGPECEQAPGDSQGQSLARCRPRAADMGTSETAASVEGETALPESPVIEGLFLSPRQEGTSLAPHLLQYQMSAFELFLLFMACFVYGLVFTLAHGLPLAAGAWGPPCGDALGWGQAPGSGLEHRLSSWGKFGVTLSVCGIFPDLGLK